MDIIVVLAILIIPALAQFFVTNSYNNYRKVNLKKPTSGWEVARKILDENNLKEIHVIETKGVLSDHYDPSRKVIRLSTEIFHGETIAAASIAAHEVGHAIQDKEGYVFLRFRSAIFPLVRISTMFSYGVIFIGFLAESLQLFLIGIALVALGLIFQLITLPVEFDASRRAKEELNKFKILNNKEFEGSNIMLKAAAYTYVAGVLSSVLELIRLIMAFNRNKKD